MKECNKVQVFLERGNLERSKDTPQGNVGHFREWWKDHILFQHGEERANVA